MAAAPATTTTTTTYIISQVFSTKNSYTSSSFPSFSATKRPQKRVLFSINNSTNDVSASTSTTSNAAKEQEFTDGTIEVTEGTPSLITALNVEKALRGIAITDVDHYGRLGLPRKCSYDQVTIAYNKKIEEMKNQGLDEEELNKQRELLKESYSILSLPEERRLYDWSMARAENADKYMWPYEVDSSKTSTETPPPAQEPEDVGPTTATGYFILGWFMISLVLLVAFNR